MSQSRGRWPPVRFPRGVGPPEYNIGNPGLRCTTGARQFLARRLTSDGRRPAVRSIRPGFFSPLGARATVASIVLFVEDLLAIETHALQNRPHIVDHRFQSTEIDVEIAPFVQRSL